VITRSGVVVACAGVLLLFAGGRADYPELVMVGLACPAALVIGVAWLPARPRLAAVREISPARVRVGDAAYGVLVVTNTGRRRCPPSAVTETVGHRRIDVALPSLAAGEEFRTTYALPTGRRGRYEIARLTFSYADPLRLWQIQRRGAAAAVLYVHPRVHDLDPVRAGGQRDADGPTSAGAPPGGVAFHSLRDYQPGDDWRRIHWLSTARTGTLMVRRDVVPDEPRHLIVLDTSAAPYDDGTFEEAVRVAASLCVAAARSGFALHCRTTGERTVPSWDSDAATALDVLAAARRSTVDSGLSALGDLVHDVAGAGADVALTVVTGSVVPEELDGLAAMRGAFPAVTLARIESAGPVSLPGVVVISAATSAEFANAWHEPVPR
jgi:uncharacterized protein (DUF58 family)